MFLKNISLTKQNNYAKSCHRTRKIVKEIYNLSNATLADEELRPSTAPEYKRFVKVVCTYNRPLFRPPAHVDDEKINAVNSFVRSDR